MLERDVSAWRPSPPESDVLAKLRALRALPKDALEAELGVRLSGAGNPYEMDTAALFHLIEAHGCDAVRDAVREMLGCGPHIKDKR